MIDREKVIKGLEIFINGCENIHCDDCCFYISTKPTRCGLREEQIKEDVIALLKEQTKTIEQLQIDLELAKDETGKAVALLKEQQREIEILKAMGLKLPEITVLTDKPIYRIET